MDGNKPQIRRPLSVKVGKKSGNFSLKINDFLQVGIFLENSAEYFDLFLHKICPSFHSLTETIYVFAQHIYIHLHKCFFYIIKGTFSLYKNIVVVDDRHIVIYIISNFKQVHILHIRYIFQ